LPRSLDTDREAGARPAAESVRDFPLAALEYVECS
jgi:hypothetical protein